MTKKDTQGVKTPVRKVRIPARRSAFLKPIEPDFSPDESRICVLTGASGVLGTEFIKTHAIDYKIIAIHNSRDLAEPITLVDPLYPSHPIINPSPISIRADLSKPEEIDALCEKIISEYGRIDVLINGACHRDWANMIADGALDHIEESFALNVLAPIRLAAGFSRLCWKVKGWQENSKENRNIINLSSTAGTYVYPDSGQGIYSSTKAALNYASHHLASEMWQIGIRVNTIAPNSFPGIVSTQSVVRAIRDCDTNKLTGQHILIDRT